jgi:hypothetical protein
LAGIQAALAVGHATVAEDDPAEIFDALILIRAEMNARNAPGGGLMAMNRE